MKKKTKKELEENLKVTSITLFLAALIIMLLIGCLFFMGLKLDNVESKVNNLNTKIFILKDSINKLDGYEETCLTKINWTTSRIPLMDITTGAIYRTMVFEVETGNKENRIIEGYLDTSHVADREITKTETVCTEKAFIKRTERHQK